MHLDVIVATYNRKLSLLRTLRSLLAAPVPPPCRVSITVADNHSRDGTPEALAAVPEFAGRVAYLFEPRQGKSFALNTALAHTRAELVAFIDDDEEIHPDWYARVFDIFRDPSVGYLGGRTLPKWPAPPPPWLPAAFPAVVGWVQGPDHLQEFGRGFPGVLMGGNAVVRRRWLSALGPGPYNTALGRKGRLLLTADDDLHRRLAAAGARGLWSPDVVVYHHVQPHMLAKAYHRRWCFANGISLGLVERRMPSPGARVLGLPRWRFGNALRALPAWPREALARRPGLAFTAQLTLLQFGGMLYGRFLYRAPP